MTMIDYILIVLIGTVLGFAFGLWNKKRKAGKTCGCDCSSCSGCNR